MNLDENGQTHVFQYSALSDNKVYPLALSIEGEVQAVLSLGH